MWGKTQRWSSWCSWLSRQSNTLKVLGSNPGEDTSFLFCILSGYFENSCLRHRHTARHPHDRTHHSMSDNGQSALESALIGCFGGLFATFCVYPLDLAKSKVSAHIKRKDDKGPDVSSIEVLKKIMATKGAAGLYEGMGGRALQCFVEDFVFFWCVPRMYNTVNPTDTYTRSPHNIHPDLKR